MDADANKGTMDKQNGQHAERISKLETSVESIHSELGDIKLSLRSISTTLSRSRETNWSVVLAGLTVCGALYAAAIRPLNVDIERNQSINLTTSAKLAEAVLIQNDRLNKLETQTSRGEQHDIWMDKQMEMLQSVGSPGADKRLSLIEFKLNQILENKKP